MGGGLLDVVALLASGLAAVSSNAMNDYSGSLALQTVGVKVRRPLSACVVTVVAFALILWLHNGDVASKFQNVLLVVGYWIPGFVAIVRIDWLARSRGRVSLDPLVERTSRRDAIWAVVTFLLGFGCAVPFMDTSLYVGAASKALAGADIAYFVGFAATAILYAPLRLGWIGPSRATVEATAAVPDQVAG